MPFSPESESNNKMSFLDEAVSRESGRFETNVHWKKSFNVYTHFDSFLPPKYKFSMIYNLR